MPGSKIPAVKARRSSPERSRWPRAATPPIPFRFNLAVAGHLRSLTREIECPFDWERSGLTLGLKTRVVAVHNFHVLFVGLGPKQAPVPHFEMGTKTADSF